MFGGATSYEKKRLQTFIITVKSGVLKVSNGVVYKAVANCDKDTLATSVGALSNRDSSSFCKLNNAVHTSPIISQKLYTQNEQQSWTCDFDGNCPAFMYAAVVRIIN